MRSSKALKSFLVLGLLCSMGNLTVKAEEEQTETDVLVTTEWTELTNAQTPVEDETTTEEDLIDPVDEYVAKIGDVGYEKVQDAIEAAENNQIILIQSDVELDELRFEESKLKGKNIILDLNGCTITTTSNCDIVHIAASDFTLTIKNGNLKTKSTGAYALYVYNDKANNKGFDNLNLILDSVNFESINQSFGVQGLNSNQNITIKNCTFTSEVVGLYYPPISGTLKIENSIINAPTGVVIKGGKVELINTKIKSDGEYKNPDIPYQGDPTNPGSFPLTGGAIYVEGGYNDRHINVTIQSGNYTSDFGKAVEMKFEEYNNPTTDRKLVISGGTFSSDPSKYLADDYGVYEGTNGFEVSTKHIELVSSVTVEQYSSRQLSAKVYTNTNNRTVTWSSSDTSIATVDENGKVTAVAPGNATITATADDMTATCAVMVTSYIPPYIPSTPKPEEPVVGGSTTESGDKVDVEEVRTDKDVKETLGKENIITTVEVQEETDEPVELTVKVGRDYKDETVYVVQQNPATGELELVATTEVDKKGNATFTTESTEELTLTTALPDGFINTAETTEEPSVTYYVEDNEIKKGWVQPAEGDWYFLDYKSGIMQKNKWVAENDKWYKLAPNGVMYSSTWLAQDSTGEIWYWVDENGSMVTNTTIDGCYIDAYGVWRANR